MRNHYLGHHFGLRCLVLSLNNQLDYAGIDRLNNRLDYARIDLGLNYFDLEVDQHSGGDVVIELK
ncbi:hypothetical protein PGT21_000987 [Puccinia graminis f. sp. tritici]|uniref:Uncharacterized protein n=1 Tax=Puccinia graminis f. sp. tritici TaxID=56615 RepID=A0A5B0Q9M5_PUCGR|nr:hypothetical protein PGT21_000987 [Puccinia graminis f. sp. tritici]